MVSGPQQGAYEEFLGGKLPFSDDNVEALIGHVARLGMPMPSRFVRPIGLSDIDGKHTSLASESPLRKKWGETIRMIKGALNSVAADAALYEELVVTLGPKTRSLTVLRNSVARILERLVEAPRSNSSFDRPLRSALNLHLSNFEGADEISDLIDGLQRFDQAILALQSASSDARDRMANLLSAITLTLPEDGERPTLQHYRILRYTQEFKAMFKTTAREQTEKQFDNYKGPYPDFIKMVMHIETGWNPSPPALTKALQRAKTI